MIFVKSNGGQLCNRIWSYLFLIAHSLHFKEHIIIADFSAYTSFFPNLSTIPNVHFLKSSYLTTLLIKTSKIFKHFRVINRFDLQKKSLIYCCEGWQYRNETIYLEKYKNDLLHLFAPNNKVISHCHSLILPIKHEKLIVGVHIRKKDYDVFFKGSYYFENSVYKKYMEKVKAELSNKLKKETSFLICSDDNIDIQDFYPLNCIKLPELNSMDDLFGLSICDYIIGPPSTFSMWASFYGSVPLRIINNIDSELSIDQFKVISAIDRFTDGSIFVHMGI